MLAQGVDVFAQARDLPVAKSERFFMIAIACGRARIDVILSEKAEKPEPQPQHELGF